MLEILFGWRKASKCKDLIKSVRCRLKLLRSKREIIVRQLSDDVAQLLKNGQDESAFIWAEQLFKNQNILAAYDLLDHFCEFIIINLPYIRGHKDCPNDVNEAISTLIFAASRCVDLPELQKLRNLFGERYGSDFVVAAVELCPGNHVNQKVRENLCISSISDDAKLKLVEEIAKDYGLQLGCQETEDGCRLKQHQVHFNEESVYGPVKSSDCGFGKQFSETNVVYGDIEGSKLKSKNDKEKLQIRHQRHFEHASLLQDNARSGTSSHCKKSVQSPRQSCDGSDIRGFIGFSEVKKCTSDVLQTLNSVTIHTSMQEVGKLDKLDPSYERTFIYLDETKDIHLRVTDYDERWLASSNLLPSNYCRVLYEEKHAQGNRPNRPKSKIGISGSHAEGKHENDYVVYRKSSSRGIISSLSGLHYSSCGRTTQKRGDLHDESVNYRNFSKRRKSERTRSRKSALHGECADTHELRRLFRINKTLSSKIDHRQGHFLSQGSSVNDTEYMMYYDESCGDYDVHFMKLKHKFSQDHHNHPSRLNLADGLHVNKHRKEIMSRNRTHPSPDCYYEQKISRDALHEVLVGGCSIPHGCRRRSCNSSSWKCDLMVDCCCLEHPCYFYACNNRIDWGSPPPKRSCIATLTGSPFSIQLQEQADPCRRRNHDSRQIKTTYRRATCAIGATEDTLRMREHMDSNSNIDSSCIVHSQSLKSKKKSNSSCVSYSSESLPPSSGSWTKLHPPYMRVMASQTPHSADLMFQQPNSHVHPKLPDYDELAAKFTALKKEHWRRNRS